MPENKTRLPSAAEDLVLITEAAAKAGEIALKYFRRDPEVWWKEGDSPVSAADLAADKYLRDVLMAARPDYGWLSEETEDSSERLQAQRIFVVDPIDGTRAFIDGRDVWCVSVAVVEQGRTIAGVLDCPAKNEIFAAALGGGAVCNGVPIAVRLKSDTIEISGAKPMLQKLQKYVVPEIKIHPYVPSLAYRIAMVANGRIDATFIKPSSHDWDLAAADLILSEAGGRMLDATGERPFFAGADPRKGALVAGNSELLEIMSRLLQEPA